MVDIIKPIQQQFLKRNGLNPPDDFKKQHLLRVNADVAWQYRLAVRQNCDVLA